MKRFIVLLIGPLVACLLMAAAPTVSSWTETNAQLADGYRITTLNWTADSTGTVTSRTTTTFFRGIIYQVITDPDTSAVPATADSSGRKPTDNYDVVLNKSKTLAAVGTALDIMGGSLANRDSVNTEMAAPKTADLTEWPMVVNGTLTVAVTGNTKPNARGHIYIYWILK